MSVVLYSIKTISFVRAFIAFVFWTCVFVVDMRWKFIMKNKFVEFNVEVNDIITPSSCSSMVIEFIKCIIYQKQLIPYNYERLKMYVPKGKTLADTMKVWNDSLLP